MKYDFTTVIDRTNTKCSATGLPVSGCAVEEGFSLIPMWVADMNFATAPSVIENIKERLAHPIFGYFSVPQEYYDSVIDWQKRRNGVEGLTKNDIRYENGVIGCLCTALAAFTLPNEPVLMHSPCYTGFSNIVRGAGRKPVYSELVQDEEGIWRMDYEDMDKKLKKHRIHFCIFCSPHNPTGRVWEKEEIEKAMEVFKNNDVIVFADEIWSDLIMPGYKHIPTQSVSEDAKNRTIAAYSPTKSFNLAGLICSYHIVYNSYLRDTLRRQNDLGYYNQMNLLSLHAQLGAYNEGEEWLDELRQVLGNNVDYFYNFFKEKYPTITMSKTQGTYLFYVDFGQWCKDHNCTIEDILKAAVRVGVLFRDGTAFGVPNTLRINVAVPFEVLKDALNRLEKYVLI